MNEQIKYFAKLTSISIFSFLKITLLGTFSTIIVLVIGFILLKPNEFAFQFSTSFFANLFSNRPVGSILWMAVFVLSPILIFTFSQKYILTKIAHKMIQDKSETFLAPFLDKFILKCQSKETLFIKNSSDYAIAKLRLIQDLQNETENILLKKIIIFGMNKIKMENIDFNSENQNFYEIIKIKTLESLKNISEPSRQFFWLILGAQFVTLIFIWQIHI